MTIYVIEEKRQNGKWYPYWDSQDQEIIAWVDEHDMQERAKELACMLGVKMRVRPYKR